jgi:phage terminase large subunit-like protein
MQEAFLSTLSEHALAALPWLFEFWALPHQVPPSGDWRTWVIMGGRGAGKTRAGSEWVRSMVEGARPLDGGRAVRVALVAETYDQARDVMVFGDSGILSCCPPDRTPQWQATKRKLVWPNGAEAQCYSASEPEALRGPQFDAAWVDELAKWKKAQNTWDMLQFCLRLGDDPRCVVTTTPRNVDVLKNLLARQSTVQTQAATVANRAYLADSFLAEVESRYGGSRLGRQELNGELLEDVEGAFWSSNMLAACRVEALPEVDRVIVAVDPPVTGHAKSDECGIVVVGVTNQGPRSAWRAYVIEDASVSAKSPLEWAQAAVSAMKRHDGDCLVAEVNQGGDMVKQIVRQVDPMVRYRAVRASKGKSARAEPIAALYEQGRVHHVGQFASLEDQMVQMTLQGFAGTGSPDRVDALVWALFEGMISPSTPAGGAAIRSL